MVVETKAFVPVLSYKNNRKKLRLSGAKLELSYEEVLSLAKVGKEVIVQARVQLLVHWA